LMEARDELKALPALTWGQRQVLVTARIESADNALAALRTPPSMGFGSEPGAVFEGLGSAAKSMEVATPAVVLEGELDSIFHDLVWQNATAKPRARASKKRMSKLKGYSAAVRDWGVYQATRVMGGELWQTGMSAPLVTWTDYSDFGDQLAPLGAANGETAGTSGEKKSVRSGDWLRHSAAARLYRVRLELRSAAMKLDRSYDVSAASEVGSVAE
jgi:hypothetical protein